MANKIIHDLTAAAGAAATDEFEIQVAGETVTKKVTLTQLTQVEATARAAQDDVIEAGAGLNTDGTFPAMTESWYLKAADFVTGLYDSGGTEANVTANLYNAVRMLDSKLYASVQPLGNAVRFATVYCSAADLLACNAVPKVLLAASTDNFYEIISIVAQLEFGTTAYVTAGGSDLKIMYTGGELIGKLNAGFFESSANIIARADISLATGSYIIDDSRGVVLFCDEAPITGDGSIRIDITYRKLGVMW